MGLLSCQLWLLFVGRRSSSSSSFRVYRTAIMPGGDPGKPPAAGETSRPISKSGVVRTLSGLSDETLPRNGNVSWDEGISSLLAGPNSRIGGVKPPNRADSVDFISPLKGDVSLLRELLFDVVRSQVSVETMNKVELIAKLSSEFDTEAEDATFATIASTVGNLSEAELQLVRLGVLSCLSCRPHCWVLG